MTKRTSRFIASLMAGIMLVASAVPAFAGTGEYEEVQELDATISGGSLTAEVPIKLQVPTRVDAIINPYAADLSVQYETVTADVKEILDAVGITTDTVSQSSIISPEYEITNESAVPVKVIVKDFKVASATTSGDIAIATSSVAAKANAPKSAFIYMQYANEDGKEFLGKTLKTPKIDEKTGKVKLYASADADKYKNALKAKNKILELKAKNEAKLGGKEGASLKPTFAIGSNKKAYIRIMGDVNSLPVTDKKSKTPVKWTSADKINISYKLVFEPQADYEVIKKAK
jgi:hypothetical protein